MSRQPLSPERTQDDVANGLILGIETSCDETAAAVVDQGEHALSNIVASQISTHSPYGGVVPELASREHLRNIVPVVRAALSEAGIGFSSLAAIAVTEGPGLAGALLVGITYAKSLAFALGKPLIAVNHLEGHIYAVLLEQHELARTRTTAAEDGPVIAGNRSAGSRSWVLALVVSGGHTHLYAAYPQAGTFTYQNIGRTVDDAAGEAFDKVAKLLGLGYPGGPWIDALATYGDPRSVPFTFAQIKRKAHRSDSSDAASEERFSRRFLFSFSGIKTAVLRYVQLNQLYPSIQRRREALAAIPGATPSDARALCDARTLGLIASFQRAVVDDLKRKTFQAAQAVGAETILVSGGVAANRELRVRFTAEARIRGMSIAFPSPALSTDNAAMIAAAAWPKFLSGQFAPPELTAQPSLAL
jgi:N6-L-threonylcarbamoyladenine synthase